RVGANTNEAFSGQTIGAVGIEPKPALQCEGDILDHDRGAGGKVRALATYAVIVVELGAADTHADVEIGVAGVIAGRDGSETGRNHGVILFGNGVRHEIRGGIGLLLEPAKIPVQLFG